MLMSVDVAPLTLDELLQRPAWHADAACREHPEISYYPTVGNDTRPAKAICAGCLVRNECLATAIERNDGHGISGGTSVKERKALRRRAA
jgi:WhiB family redox-sensing transcriptional regulator